MKCEIRINGRQFELDPENIKQSLAERWHTLPRNDMGLGNAAGVRLVSAEVQVLDLFRTSSFSSVWSTLQRPEDTEQKAELVVRHLGLDLAHRKADSTVKESRFSMVVPIGTKSFSLDIAGSKTESVLK